MFPAGHTQVNSSLASPDYMGPGLGLREAALPLPPGSAWQPPGHLISEQGGASDPSRDMPLSGVTLQGPGWSWEKLVNNPFGQSGVFYEGCCCECTKSCSILCDPMDCSLPDSSVHGISQARILEWVAISFSRGSSRPRDWTPVSCIIGRYSYHYIARETLNEDHCYL